MKIEILTWEDKHECETCGCSWARGGQVKVDDEIIIFEEPIAHCFNGRDFDSSDLLIMALNKLGHTVSIDYKEVDL
jgi:hypothetical protein